MIIESLKDYISTCPYLYEFNKEINVDYLDDDSTTYSIDEGWELVETREGTVMENLVGAPSLCSAYYSLCDDYGIEYHYQ